MSNVHAFQPFGLALHIEALHFTVEAVSHLFEHDISVGILARMLPVSSDACKDFIHIGHVEITTQRQILGTPVIAAQERMHIRYTTLPGGGITQMPHIHFPRKRQVFLGIFGVIQLFGSQILEIALHIAKYLCYRSRPQGPFAKHIFFTGVGFQLHARQSRTFLSPVMLLLHQQI